MPKWGSVIFKQFRHMKNLPLPGSGYFKKLPPPVYVTGPKCNPLPPPPPLRTRRASDCEIAYNTCSGRLPINQNPLQGHLWSYSMEALNKESEFAAPVLTWAQKFKREVNGRKVCKELIARIEPRGCTSETRDKNYKQWQRSCTCIRSRASREESLSALCFVKNYLCSMMMRLSPVLKD